MGKDSGSDNSKRVIRIRLEREREREVGGRGVPASFGEGREGKRG